MKSSQRARVKKISDLLLDFIYTESFVLVYSVRINVANIEIAKYRRIFTKKLIYRIS